MWRWLLINLIFIPNVCVSAPTSAGAVSSEESQILWNDGSKAYSIGQYQDAVNSLERYVARYPGSPHYFQSQLLLGKSWFELNRPKDAERILKDFLNSPSPLVDQAEAKIYLGLSHIQLNKFQEALLLSKEIEQIQKKTSLPSPFIIQSLLLKAKALAGLHHTPKALQAMDSAGELLEKEPNQKLFGQLLIFQLQLKLHDCFRYPSYSPLDEGQIRNQIEQKGVCLLEGLLIYRKLLKNGEIQSLALADNEMIDAFHNYNLTCSHPLSKQNFKKTKLTPQEMKNYQRELTDRVLQDCKEKWISALGLLKSWQDHLSPPSSRSLNQSILYIEKLVSRGP